MLCPLVVLGVGWGDRLQALTRWNSAEPTGDAETSIFGWEEEFVECSISDAEVIAEGREVDAGGLRTEETKKHLQRCIFQHFLLQVVKSRASHRHKTNIVKLHCQ